MPDPEVTAPTPPEAVESEEPQTAFDPEASGEPATQQAVATGATVEPPTAEKPAEPKPGDTAAADLQAKLHQAEAYQRLSEQQVAQAQVQQRATQQQQELLTAQQSWQQQGYDEAQIAQGIQQLRTVQQRETEVTLGKASLMEQARLMQEGATAKVAKATDLSSQYGIPITDLMKFNSPQEMEIASLKHSIAKTKENAAPPQEFETEKSDRTGSSRDVRMEYLATKETEWTDAETAEYRKLTARV